MAWHQFAGMPRKSYLPDHIAFVARIVDPSNHYQRPGFRMWGGTASGTINHETDNYNIGADSGMHATYLENGPVDQYGNRMDVSWHFCVDGGSTSKGHGPAVSQSIPCDEVSWQAACGGCGGNYDRVSIEQCKNRDGDTAKARDAHEWLTASIHETLGVDPHGTTDLHYEWNKGTLNRHHCPDTMLDDGYVIEDALSDPFRDEVKRKYAVIVQMRIAAEGEPVPPKPDVVYAAAVLPEWFTSQDAQEHPTDQKFRDATAYVCKRNYKAIAGTVRRSEPVTTAPASGPKVIIGEKVFGIRIWNDPVTGQTWILEETGNWLLGTKFSPRVRIEPRG